MASIAVRRIRAAPALMALLACAATLLVCAVAQASVPIAGAPDEGTVALDAGGGTTVSSNGATTFVGGSFLTAANPLVGPFPASARSGRPLATQPESPRVRWRRWLLSL